MAKQRPHKFKPGAAVTSMSELDDRLSRREWMYFNDKPMHPAFLGNMSYWSLNVYLRKQMIRAATPTEGTEQ